MDVALQAQGSVSYRAVFQERSGLKLNPFLGSFQHGRLSHFVQVKQKKKKELILLCLSLFACPVSVIRVCSDISLLGCLY